MTKMKKKTITSLWIPFAEVQKVVVITDIAAGGKSTNTCIEH